MRLLIEPGLTGIVGPNGCGKSNLLEAMRWVMGAASARALRGEDMDDVIFAGSGTRPAREHAEVAIVLGNEDGRAPEAWAQAESLEILRRIRRQAGSTFRINGKDVRARDVQLLFADAATGANSPSLVRQGQVSELINARPDNRRRILEDAAGIAGLQARRHDAELKLRAAEANLTRVDEISREIGAGLADLREQARKAERYRSVQAEIRALEALLAALKWRERLNVVENARMLARAAEDKGRLALAAYEDASTAETAAARTLKPLEEEELIAGMVATRYASKAEALIRAQTEAEAALARAASDLARIATDAAREQTLEDDAKAALARLAAEAPQIAAETGPDPQVLASAREAADHADRAREMAERALESEAARLAGAKARAESAARDHQAALAREAQAAAMLERARAAHAALASGPVEESLAAARAAVTIAETRDAEAAQAVESADSAWRAADRAEGEAREAATRAENRLRALEAEAEGLRKSLARPPAVKFRPVMEDLRVEPGFERALAAALGDDLEAGLGAEAPLHWSGASFDGELPPWAAGLEPLAARVAGPASLRLRLGACAIVDHKEGPTLQKHLLPGQRLVSREGDLWRWDGFVRRAEAPGPQAARLEMLARAEALARDIADARGQAEQAQAAHRGAREMRTTAEAVLKQARAALPALRAALASARTAEGGALREFEKLGLRAESLDAERARADAALAEAKAALSAAEANLARAPMPETEAELTRARATAEAQRQTAAAARAEIARLSGEHARADARRNAHRSETEAWTTRFNATAQRLNQLARLAIEAENARDSLLGRPEAFAAERQKLADALKDADRRKTRATDALREAQAQLKAAERRKREAEKLAGEARETRAATLARLEAAADQLQVFEAEIRQVLGAGPDQLAEEAATFFGPRAREWDIPRAEERSTRLRREREAMGAVNLAADEAVNAWQERLSHLARERDDITGAIAKLRQSGQALDAEGRERLKRAFDIVNTHFQSLFQTLFEGGHAELKLTETEDALSAGLEIYACPPGKRLASMSLMSGGEQALTATALIFAVFLSNPSPICVLDEVDAPLDDANVERFCRMLDEMRKRTDTRFLVITHNPVTMARMDRLFGVTMAEQGVSTLVSVDLRQAAQMIEAA